MNNYKKYSALSLTILSFIVLFVIVYKYSVFIQDKKEEKENIEVEIINGDKDDSSAEEEMEEEIIENDAENLEINESEENYTESTESEKSSTTGTILPFPVIERKDPDELRIGFITDLHVKSNSDWTGGRILKTDYVNKINYFVEKMNNDFVPNFIVINGDVIEGTNTSFEKGMAELSQVKKLFDRTSLEKYWVVGNHDLRSVNKKQFMQSLEIDYISKAFEVGNYKIIILDSNFKPDDSDIVPGKYHTRGHISKKQIEFLKKELGNTDKKTIVFLHHAPFWNIEGRSNNGLPDNAKELQKVFSEKKTFAVFSGHIEDLFLQTIDGVKYFVSPGIVKNEKYQGTFSEVTLKEHEMIVEMSYLENGGNYRTILIREN